MPGELTVSRAVETAVAVGLGLAQVGAELLGRGPEVVDGAGLVGEDVAGGDEDVVHADALPAVGQVEGVVQRVVGLVVAEAVQVPVRVAAEHDGRLLGRRDGHHLEVPGGAVHGVGDVGDDLAGEALLAVRVHDRERDAVRGVGDDGEVAVVPAVRPAVQRVGAVVLVWLHLVRRPVDLERAVLDAVRVAPGHAAEVRVVVRVLVGRRVVPPHDDVPLDPVLVLEQELRDGRAVGDEGRLDLVRLDPVEAVLVRA